jgi:hypothetical protein
VISKYSLQNSSTQVGGWSNDIWSPTHWTFESSNDGTAWSVLDTQEDRVILNDEPKKVFHLENTSSNQYYRINISENNG